MAEDLRAALEKVRVSALSMPNQDGWIDGILEQQIPRKRQKRSKDELKKDLERDFLTPPTRFSIDWLNKLQQYVRMLSTDGKRWLNLTRVSVL